MDMYGESYYVDEYYMQVLGDMASHLYVKGISHNQPVFFYTTYSLEPILQAVVFPMVVKDNKYSVVKNGRLKFYECYGEISGRRNWYKECWDSFGASFVEERIVEYMNTKALDEDVNASRKVFVEVATRMLEEKEW